MPASSAGSAGDVRIGDPSGLGTVRDCGRLFRGFVWFLFIKVHALIAMIVVDRFGYFWDVFMIYLNYPIVALMARIAVAEAGMSNVDYTVDVHNQTEKI